MKKIISVFIFSWVLSLNAQVDSLPKYSLDSIFVSVGRIDNTILLTPNSTSSIEISKIQKSRQQTSINEYLTDVPGLFTFNANNYAQDLRISIRGFGSRSAFGIRGVKILVDGIPETTPDGQGQTDNLDLALFENIEILRGPASGLYGNASGGILSISTQSDVTKNFLETGTTFGSFGLQRYQLKGGLKKGATDLVFQASQFQINGFRQNSGVEHRTISSNFKYQFSDKTWLKFIFNYTGSPQADDPGGVDLATIESDRTEARQQNLLFQSGESVNQLKLATIFESGDFETKFYYINRDFIGRLPFEFGGIINLNRNFFGHSSSYNWEHSNNNFKNQLQFGYDLQWQDDDRQRFENLEGEQGAITFNQEENFLNAALFLVDNLKINKWNIEGSLRYDFNRLSANDLILSNGDDSGIRQLNALNGGLGISLNLQPYFIPFAKFSTSFETPTLSELSANPTGTEGFNNSLEAITALNYELGAKGLIINKLYYDLAVYQINTTNEILPFEIVEFPERDFFRNAGKTQRIGFETALKWRPTKPWEIIGTYTFSDFTFEESNNLNGEKLPGIPTHSGAISVRYISPKGSFFKITGQRIGQLFADDANSVVVDAYSLLNLNLGYEIKHKNFQLTPFFGINNLLNTKYNDNVRINAFGGRYFEPAPGINIFGGIKLRLNKV